MPSQSDLASYLYLAASEPSGIWLTTPHPQNLRSMLYACRAREKNPALANLEIRLAPRRIATTPADALGFEPELAIWIVNKTEETP